MDGWITTGMGIDAQSLQSVGQFLACARRPPPLLCAAAVSVRHGRFFFGPAGCLDGGADGCSRRAAGGFCLAEGFAWDCGE